MFSKIADKVMRITHGESMVSTLVKIILNIFVAFEKESNEKFSATRIADIAKRYGVLKYLNGNEP